MVFNRGHSFFCFDPTYVATSALIVFNPRDNRIDYNPFYTSWRYCKSLTTSVTNSASPTSVAASRDKHLASIIGGVLGGSVVIAIVCGIILVALRRSKKRKMALTVGNGDRSKQRIALELSALNDLSELADTPRCT
jgi:hypothetical protein